MDGFRLCAVIQEALQRDPVDAADFVWVGRELEGVWRSSEEGYDCFHQRATAMWGVQGRQAADYLDTTRIQGDLLLGLPQGSLDQRAVSTVPFSPWQTGIAWIEGENPNRCQTRVQSGANRFSVWSPETGLEFSPLKAT